MSNVEKSSTIKKKTGGRVKGTPNKSTEYIFDLCKKNNFDPIEALIHVAKNNWEKLGYSSPEIEKQGFQGIVTYEPVVSMDHRIDAMKTLVSYMYPKRKAIEHSLSDNEKNAAFTFAYNTAPMKQDEKS